MSDATQDRIRPVTIVLIVAAVLTAILGIAVAVSFFSRPKPITLTITDPAGGVVLCDLLIDGRPESRRDTAPVTYVFQARQLAFAVTPEAADAGPLSVEISAGGGTGSAGGAGVRGTATVGTVGGGVSIGNMTPQHAENMRTSRARTFDATNDAQIDESVPDASVPLGEPPGSSSTL